MPRLSRSGLVRNGQSVRRRGPDFRPIQNEMASPKTAPTIPASTGKKGPRTPSDISAPDEIRMVVPGKKRLEIANDSPKAVRPITNTAQPGLVFMSARISLARKSIGDWLVGECCRQRPSCSQGKQAPQLPTG